MQRFRSMHLKQFKAHQSTQALVSFFLCTHCGRKQQAVAIKLARPQETEMGFGFCVSL